MSLALPARFSIPRSTTSLGLRSIQTLASVPSLFAVNVVRKTARALDSSLILSKPVEPRIDSYVREPR